MRMSLANSPRARSNGMKPIGLGFAAESRPTLHAGGKSVLVVLRALSAQRPRITQPTLRSKRSPLAPPRMTAPANSISAAQPDDGNFPRASGCEAAKSRRSDT